MAESLQWKVVEQLVDESPITKREADRLYHAMKKRKKAVTTDKWRTHYKNQPNWGYFREMIWTMKITKDIPLTIKIGGSIHIEFQVTKEHIIGYIYSYPGIIDIAPRFKLSGTPKQYDKTSYECDNFKWKSQIVKFALFLWEGYLQH